MRHVQPRREGAVRSRKAGHALTLRQLAHELNSMLDGSMRCVSIARQALEEAGGDPDAVRQAAARLNIANENMQAMATLLEQTLRGNGGFESRSLGEEVQRIIASCNALAEEVGVDIDLHLDPAAAQLPTGPLGPILLNGLRNAIEACSASSEGCRQVELSIGITDKDYLELFVTDTGPGVHGSSGKPAGHGIGLEVCRRIAAGLGGNVELMNVPFGGGAVLRVHVPLSRLQRG